jgi:GAF domain-containing protein
VTSQAPLETSEARGGILVVRDGRVVYASDGVAALAERPLGEIVGRPAAELLVPEDGARLREIGERSLRGETVPRSLEVALQLPAGARCPVEWRTAPDGADEIVHVRDLGEDTARRLLLGRLAEIGASIRAERSEEGVHARVRVELGRVGAVCALIRDVAGRSEVVWVTSPEELRRELERSSGGAPMEGFTFTGPASPFTSRVLAEGCAFTDDWAGGAAAHVPPGFAADARALVLRAGFARAIGVRIDAPREEGLFLVVASPLLRGGDQPAVRLFGAQVSAALDAARTIADLSRRNAHLAVLAQVAELAGDATDLATFFARASEVIRPVAGCSGIALYVCDDAAGELVRAHLDPSAPALLEERSRRVPMASPLGDVVRDRSTRVVEMPYPGGNPAIIEALPYRSLVWVPLVSRSRGVGVLAAGFDRGVGAAQGAVELLTAVGAHFSSALESHRLLGDLRRRVDELTLLVDVARASAQLDPGLLLEGALRRVAVTVGAEVAGAWLREGDRLALVSSVGLEPACAASVADLGPGEGAPGLAVERRAAVRTPAAEAFGPRPAACSALRTVIAVPLLAKSDAVGALLFARREGTPFGDGDAALLYSIGAQLGVAVAAARLFADVRRRLSDLEAVHALTLRVFANAPGDVAALLQDACRELVGALSAPTAAVFLTAPDGATLRQAASVGLPASLRDLVLDRDLGFSAEVMRSRAALQSEDVTRDPRSRLAGRADVEPLAVLAVPLVSRRGVRGLIYVGDRAGRRFGPGEVAVANALAAALGVGLENADLYSEARRRVEELSALNEVSRGIGASLELHEVLRDAAEAARRLVGSARAFVLVHDLARGEVAFGAGAGFVEAAPEESPVEVPQGTVLERVLRERRAEVVPDTSLADMGELYFQRRGGSAVVVVPVLLRGEPVGALVAEELDRPRRFSDSDVERLTAIADRLAVAMENARLYRETRDRAEQLALLHEVGRSLTQTLEIERLLEDGVRNLARIVSATGAHLWLLSDDGETVRCRAVSGPHDGMRGVTLPATPPENNLASRVIASREPLLLEDGTRDPRARPDLRALSGGRGYLALPLVVHDRAVGAVVIFDRRGPRLFTPAEAERAAAVASQLAVAAENARLYEDLRRSYAKLARAQQKLVQGERLAALGELSAVVAHEVRNPLGVIFNSLGSLRRLVRPVGDAKMLLDIVQEEAERLNRIVGDLLDFARPSTPEVRPEELGRLAEDAVAAAVLPLGGRIEVVRELDPALPPIAVDARLVRQAVLNVAVNAVQAMARGGRLTVRARRDGDAAVVEIEDTGDGIPGEVRERIFEPFFTTKASGTGLGLAVVRRIVEGHGGEIRVRSTPGEGTTFALRFPLPPPPVENGPAMR